MEQTSSIRPRLPEFDWLKVLAFILLVFVHSDLESVFPEIILPLKWFMISCFFFVSGFLAFNSFHKRSANIRVFLKTKLLLLYVPFVAAILLYFGLQTTIEMAAVNIWQLLSSVTLLNIFDSMNTLYNWGFLWFIPYLLLFMLIFCLLEKYVKNLKAQVLLVLLLWFITLLAWVFDTELKLGLLFSQYFLVFMIGVWLNKLGLYEKVMSVKTALVTVPFIALFALDFSSLFTFDSALETLKALLYSNVRSIILSLSGVLLVLILLRKLRFPRNRFVELIAITSIFIYLLDPFFGFIVSNYVFGQPTMYVSDGVAFYLYLIARIFILLVLLPFVVNAIRCYARNNFPR
jgi:hypothetical protein